MVMMMNKAYKKGFKAWDFYLWTELPVLNPFKKYSHKWYMWNFGWNQNLKGIV